MKQIKSFLSLLLLLGVLNSGGFVFAQDATEAPAPSQEVIVEPTAVPVVETPVAEVPAEGKAGVPYLSPDVAVIAGTVILVLVLSGAFVLAFRALDAVKLSVPAETTAAVGAQIVEGVTKIMGNLSTRVKETESPVDDMFLAVANVPIHALIQEIQRRTNSPIPVELMVAAGLAVEETPKQE